MESFDREFRLLSQILSPVFAGPEARTMEGHVRSIFGSGSLTYHQETSLDDCLGDKRALLLLITPRSGSSHLCELMRSTNMLGLPAEYANWPDVAATGFAAARGESLQQYMRSIIKEYSSDTGVFTMKGSLYQFAPLIRAGIIRPGLQRVHYVYLTRGDVLAQAVSLSRAARTGKWSNRYETQKEAGYEACDILERLGYFTVMMERWELLFALMNIHPLRITYEQLVANPAGLVQQLGALMGVNISPAGLQSSLRPLRDKVSVEWEERIRALAHDYMTKAGDLKSDETQPRLRNSLFSQLKRSLGNTLGK